MKRAPLLALIAATGTAWAGLAYGVICLTERDGGSETSSRGFLVDSAGRYHLNPAQGMDLYAISRSTEHHGRTAHFLWWPLYNHYWGTWEWKWAETGAGAGRTDLPAPTRDGFTGAAASLDRISRMPGVDYLRIAVPGGPFSQRVFHTPGVVALLACCYLLAGPLTVWVATGAKRPRIVSRAERRAAAGLCPACGYRLGVAGARRCPECGTPV
ncbi:MAG TPA: hypothetical protein VEB22_05405 [Phycisphaerales bacterium]|nr:hypothetical protein [Phycisphaerales bacterium]